GKDVFEVALCFGWRSKVFPAQAEIDGEIWPELPVVLNEQTKIGGPEIERLGCGSAARERIDSNRFENRRSVGEIPRPLENVVRPGVDVQVAIVLVAIAINTELQRMGAVNLRDHVAERKGVLAKDARGRVALWSAKANPLPIRKRQSLNLGTRNGPVHRGIRSDLIERKAGEVEARFIYQ